jgi:hypothetical protein
MAADSAAPPPGSAEEADGVQVAATTGMVADLAREVLGSQVGLGGMPGWFVGVKSRGRRCSRWGSRCGSDGRRASTLL